MADVGPLPTHGGQAGSSSLGKERMRMRRIEPRRLDAAQVWIELRPGAWGGPV